MIQNFLAFFFLISLSLSVCVGTQSVNYVPHIAAATKATMQILLPIAIREQLKYKPEAREAWLQTETVITQVILPILSGSATKQPPPDSTWGIPAAFYAITSSIIKTFTGFELIELATKDLPKDILTETIDLLKAFAFIIESTLGEK